MKNIVKGLKWFELQLFVTAQNLPKTEHGIENEAELLLYQASQ